MKKETGGSAFPTNPTFYVHECDGMTLRDYFAAKAMSGIFSSGTKLSIGPSHSSEMDNLATGCYLMADAMLKARSA